MGGLSAEFFERVARKYGVPFEWPPEGQCGQHRVPWASEPHVAEQVFFEMIRDADDHSASSGARDSGAGRAGAAARQKGSCVAASSHRECLRPTAASSAAVFVDASTRAH